MVNTKRKPELEKEILRFKMQLIRKFPFYGEIFLKVDVIEDRGIPTACTNGRVIRYNPYFFEGLSEGERNFVLMHELFHILLLHCKRDRDKDPKVWNIACDYVVNHMLNYYIMHNLSASNIPFERPEQGCFQYLGQEESAERIYYRLIKGELECDRKNKYATDLETVVIGDSNGSTGLGNESASVGKTGIEAMDGSSLDPMLDGKLLEEFVKGIVKEAMDKSRGTMGSCYVPRSLLWVVESKLLPWNRYLKGMLQGEYTEETSYATPERKYLHMDLIIPGVERREDVIGQVWAFIDSSGSVGENELNQFFTQIYRISKEFECEINIAYWDTSVTDVYRKIRSEKDLMHAIPHHSGGTDINCVYRYLEEEKIKPESLLILTDGYFGSLQSQFKKKKLQKKTILVLSTDYRTEDMADIGRLACLK